MSKKKITLLILGCLIFSDFLETFTNLFFKKSAQGASSLNVTDLNSLALFLKTVAFSPYLWIAFVSVFLTFVIWSMVLSKIDLSVAVPVASFSYILVTVASIVFLHEHVSLARWLGILFVLSGVIFVSMSSKEKEHT